MRIVVDSSRCSSIGMCEAVAPDVFEIRADGTLAILLDRVAERRRAEMVRACQDCPTQALAIVEE
jgi:ferredoxin